MSAKPGPIAYVVLEDLTEGYGVEDIAVHRDLKVQSIRACVVELRNMGVLAMLYAGPR